MNIINPQKHEVIIDPACGTAGFLVSAYQHVKSQHELPGGGTTLSIPDLTRLADNLNGYDISPEMTKLAMANMYLHTQDKNPNIANYDTLTSADHWNEYADVMLANPPFMTPKGGIRPHSRFPRGCQEGRGAVRGLHRLSPERARAGRHHRAGGHNLPESETPTGSCAAFCWTKAWLPSFRCLAACSTPTAASRRPS